MEFTNEEMELLKKVVPLGAMDILVIHGQVRKSMIGVDTTLVEEIHELEAQALLNLSRKISSHDNRTA